MKIMAELKVNECKYALTTGKRASDKSWAHARLGDTKGVFTEGEWRGGGNYKHGFCGKPTGGKTYCAEHHALCYRGLGKDARSLEEMIYATDQSQHRGRSSYAEHTDGIDHEVKKEEEANTRKPETREAA